MLILFANFLLAIAKILDMLISMMTFIVIVQALLSWVNPDPFNPVVRFLNSATEPLLRPIRRYLPPIGGRIDISPILLLLLLIFLQTVLVKTLADYAVDIHNRAMHGATLGLLGRGLLHLV